MKQIIKSMLVLVVFATVSNKISAQLNSQLNPLTSQYFQNPYIANPAMAGINSDLRVNMGLRSQWGSISGGPQNTSITADFGTNKLGLGLNIYRDQAGLLSRNKVMGTYAYHLPLSDEEKGIQFGLSLGVQYGHLDSWVGSPTDAAALDFNKRETILDGDFGVAYTSNKLIVEGALYNLKQQFKGEEEQNTADYATSYLATSYKADLGSWMLTSKVAYRFVKNFKDMFDIGFEAKTAANQLGFSTIYHSNQSYSFAFSYQKNKQWQFLSSYTTNSPSINTLFNGGFEIGLQLNLSKMKREEKVDIKN